MFELRLDFNDRDFQPFQHAGIRAIKEMGSAIQLSGFAIRNKMVIGINKGERHGHIYYRRKISHRAAADGEYPKTDTGRLVGSIRVDSSFLTADVGSDVNYSQYLEKGTKFMGAKPWAAPSLEAARPEILHIVQAALERAFRL